MTAIAGFNAQLYITSTPSVAFTNLVLTDSGDHKTFTTPVGSASKRYWDKSIALTVQTSPDGSTWGTVSSGFTIQYVGGVIVFSSAVTGATPGCRISSGSYMPFSFLGDCSQCDITPTTNIQDVTVFQNPPSPWKTKLAMLSEATIKIGKYWVDPTFASYLGNRCIISAYSGRNANARYECYAFLKQDGVKFDVNKAIDEALDFESDGYVYYIPS